VRPQATPAPARAPPARTAPAFGGTGAQPVHSAVARATALAARRRLRGRGGRVERVEREPHREQRARSAQRGERRRLTAALASQTSAQAQLHA